MAEAILDVRLDTVQPNRVRLIYGVQNDYNSRYLCVRFTVNGKSIDIESTAAVRINAKRPDGNNNAFPGTVNTDGTVKVPVAQWMLDVEGEVEASVTAVSETGALTTQEFYIFAKKSIWDSIGEPSEESPDKDVLQMIIASENERVIAETERVKNENERITAESERADAEYQRLLDEQKRIENEAIRVDNEEIREIKFNSWESDIDSLPSFDARISRNDKRITNLEQGVMADAFETDETVAYVKNVPKNALPYAAVSKIGGMTRKSKNLFVASNVSKTVIGITYSYMDGYVTVSGTKGSGSNVHSVTTPNIVLPAGTYTMSLRMVGGTATGWNSDTDGFFFGINGDTYAQRTTPCVQKVGDVGVRTITLDAPTAIASFDIASGYASVGAVFSNVLLACQFEASNTMTNYEEGFDGLRDSKVTEIKSVGVNLFNSEVLPIPEPVQKLDGYGEGADANVYNFIDLQSKTYMKMVESVDLGSLSWRTNGTIFYAVVPNLDIKNIGRGVKGIGVCAAYEMDNYNNVSVAINDKRIGYTISDTKYIAIVDSAYSDATALKNALAGVMFIFAVETPIETDISDLLTDDNLIKVEGGGTVTMVNEYGYDVPSTVVYQIGGTESEVSA